jgi:hypothetical protein
MMHQQRDGTVVVNNASYYMLQLQHLMHYYAMNWWQALPTAGWGENIPKTQTHFCPFDRELF